MEYEVQSALHAFGRGWGGKARVGHESGPTVWGSS